MTDKVERRVYYADCYWLRAYGYVSSISGKFNDGTKCLILDDGTGTSKYPEINIVRCPVDCVDYKDGEGRHFGDR